MLVEDYYVFDCHRVEGMQTHRANLYATVYLFFQTACGIPGYARLHRRNLDGENERKQQQDDYSRYQCQYGSSSCDNLLSLCKLTKLTIIC